jgi:hypothetical protein
LNDFEVGDYLGACFVSAYQKVGAFTIAGGAKQGGNVASYFCTPERRVLHVVAGPTDAATFLREARWAAEAFKLAKLESPADDRLLAFFRQAHQQRLGEEGVRGAQAKVHRLLARDPLPPIERVYRKVFEGILKEKVSSAPVREVE